jgi:hypothetical protein
MSAAIKARAEKSPANVKVSKTTGGAYADMADVIESELGQVLDKYGVSKNTRERRQLITAKKLWLRRRALASGK